MNSLHANYMLGVAVYSCSLWLCISWNNVQPICSCPLPPPEMPCGIKNSKTSALPPITWDVSHSKATALICESSDKAYCSLLDNLQFHKDNSYKFLEIMEESQAAEAGLSKKRHFTHVKVSSSCKSFLWYRRGQEKTTTFKLVHHSVGIKSKSLLLHLKNWVVIRR
jgi:hypothetical protein